MSPPVLASLRDVHLVRGTRTVLEIPALDVAPGDTWVLVGPNGAGKTTLLRTLALLDPPAKGDLVLFGEPIRAKVSLALRRRIVTTFQETLLLDTTVLANVALPLSLRGASRSEASRAALAALALFAADHLADRNARRLSGGEARRVALARGFACKPELLLLDEPFAALDPPSRESLASQLKEAIHATGTTCVAVTHDRSEALTLSDHTGVILDGRLVQAGPTDLVFRTPANDAVARFIGVENLLRARIAERGAQTFRLEIAGTPLTCMPSPVTGDTALACIRAEDILLTRGSAATLSARNAVPCTIHAIEPAPAGVYVRLAGPFPLVALLTRAAVDELELTRGTAVTACFKSTAVHLA